MPVPHFACCWRLAPKHEPRPNAVGLCERIDDVLDMEPMHRLCGLVVVVPGNDPTDADLLGPLAEIVGDVLKVVVPVDVHEVEGAVWHVPHSFHAPLPYDMDVVGPQAIRSHLVH